jgi:hypothetical protein
VSSSKSIKNTRFKLEATIGGVVFGNRFSDVRLLRLGLVGVSVTERDGARSCLVTEELTSGGLIDRRIDGVTVDTARLDALAARADAEELSLGLVDLRAQHVRWQLPEGTKFADALVWSPTLHDAAHAILKRIGNVRAQQVALDEQSSTDGHQHKQYAAVKRGVYFESYLNLPPRLASALFRTRSDSQPTEDHVRRKPHRPRKSLNELPRLDERLERAARKLARLGRPLLEQVRRREDERRLDRNSLMLEPLDHWRRWLRRGVNQPKTDCRLAISDRIGKDAAADEHRHLDLHLDTPAQR